MHYDQHSVLTCKFALSLWKPNLIQYMKAFSLDIISICGKGGVLVHGQVRNVYLKKILQVHQILKLLDSDFSFAKTVPKVCRCCFIQFRISEDFAVSDS